MVTYLMARLRANWGATLSQEWDRAGDEERKAKVYRRVRAEYADVIVGRDREFVDVVIARAKAQYLDYVPRPPQLQAIVKAVADEWARAAAQREQVKQAMLPAPKVDPERVYAGRAYLRAFVKCRGSLGRMP